MLAAVLKDFNHLVLEDVPTPQPGVGEVVVRIRSCGFCATDYKAIKGIRRNVDVPLHPRPRAGGRRGGGRGRACGTSRRATKSSASPRLLRRLPALQGRQHRTTANTPSPPAATARTTSGRAPSPSTCRPTENCLFHKPAAISFDAAALTEPLSGAWKGLIQYSQMQVGDDVVVIGVGGIGLLCLMVARAAGAGRLIAVDPSDYARHNALALGATHVSRPGKRGRQAAGLRNPARWARTWSSRRPARSRPCG